MHKLINLRQGFGTRNEDLIPLRAMSPVFMNEFESRRDYYCAYLNEEAGIDIDGKSNEELLELLQNHLRKEYDALMDWVYREKGYDQWGIPTEKNT